MIAAANGREITDRVVDRWADPAARPRL